MRKLILLVFAVSAAFAQDTPASKPDSASSPKPNTAQQQTEPKSQQAPSAPAEVPPNAPVITLRGVCAKKPAATDEKSAPCETVVTRAQFEHLADTLSPDMPASAKQKLAADYAKMLILATEARQRGLEKTERFNELVNFLKMQVLAQELIQAMQQKAKPSDQQIQAYYDQNKAKYEELSLKRVFIPRNRPTDTAPSQKAGSAEPPKPRTDTELQAEGEKYRAQLVAGADFEKVQKQAYESAGFKTPPPPTAIPNWRREAVPAGEQQIFELQPKQFSKVIIQPAGAYIYQVEEKTTLPLAQVKPQIEAMLTNEQMRDELEKMLSSVKPEVNEAYFRSLGGESTEPPDSLPNAPSPDKNNSAPESKKLAPEKTAPVIKSPK